MIRYFYRTLFWLTVIAPVSAFAEGEASVSASVDRSEILIGDRVEYALTIEYDDGIEVQKPSWGEGLEGFQILDFDQGQPSRVAGRWRVIDTYTLSTFTPEDYVIPPIGVPITLPSGATQTLQTQPIEIHVKSLLPEDEEALLELRDLKGPVSVYSGILTDRIVAVAVGILLVALIAYLLWRRKHREEEPVFVAPPRSEHEVAFERLRELRRKIEGWEGEEALSTEQCKEFSLELSEAFREYLERRFQFLALEMTTEEIETHIAGAPVRGTPPNGSLNDKTLVVLKETDLMKFAKMTRPADRLEDLISETESLVDSTKRSEETESVAAVPAVEENRSDEEERSVEKGEA